MLAKSIALLFLFALTSCGGVLSLDLQNLPGNTGPVFNWSYYIQGSNSRNTVSQYSLKNTTLGQGTFAISPTTGKIYVLDGERGLVSSDGLVITNIFSPKTNIAAGDYTWNKFNLSDDGPISSTSSLNLYLTKMTFDSQGRLYIIMMPTGSAADLNLTSSRVYQIDFQTNRIRRYLGGGVQNTSGQPALDTFVYQGPIAFNQTTDEMYFLTLCTASPRHKIMKVSQNPDGTAGAVTHVAGDCSNANPTSGALATASGLGTSTLWVYASFAAFTQGGKEVLYFNTFGLATVWKMIDGTMFSTAISSGSNDRGLLYNSANTSLFTTDSTTRMIENWSVNIAGANGEAENLPLRVGGGSAPGCNLDGVSRASACVSASLAFDFCGGDLCFLDGPFVNSGKTPRIRKIDSSGDLRNVFGIYSFYGKDLNRTLAFGAFGGIYYKQESEGNLTAFPSGLYFSDHETMVFGRVDQNDEMKVIWGSGAYFNYSSFHANSTIVSPNLSLGEGYTANARAMTFDNQGLPWIRYNNRLVALDQNNAIVNKAVGPALWNTVAPGSPVSTSFLNIQAGTQNLVVKNDAAFLMGNDNGASAPMIRNFDFAQDEAIAVIGAVGGPVLAQDSLVPEDLSTKNLTSCVQGHCALQLDDGDTSILEDDLLYFSEGLTFRSIQNPLTPGQQLLKTYFTVSGASSGRIENFIVSKDRKFVFFTYEEKLRCRPLVDSSQLSANHWCKSEIIIPLPSTMVSIKKITNQMTWKDSNTLLIANGREGVYQLVLPQ